jgi:long-chain acyl-CoA synthetase
VENKLKESFFIEQAMVIGENEKFVSALISPNFEFLHDWCSIHHVRYRDNKELVEHPEVIERYQKEINKYNAQLGEAEKIRRFKLVCEEWSPETGELSPTQKLKREFIYKKYADIISEIYKHDKKKNGNNLIDIPLKTLKEIKRELSNGLTSIKNSSRN